MTLDAIMGLSCDINYLLQINKKYLKLKTEHDILKNKYNEMLKGAIKYQESIAANMLKLCLTKDIKDKEI